MRVCLILTVLFILSFLNAYSHTGIHGKVLDAKTNLPLQGVLIKILNTDNKITYTDQEGKFEFSKLLPGVYFIEYNSIGYLNKTDTVILKDQEHPGLVVLLEENLVELGEIVIAARKELSETTIYALDFKLRPHQTTQDLLRLVPGLFIAQHAGGGKAEQLFLRGFDIDHGTDVAISVDGMPVNMVSHAHGQGYADLHFVIPETVENMNFSKGPYDAKTGDFNTAGAVKLRTKNFVQRNMVKYEIGKFGAQRTFAQVNLIPHKDSADQMHNAYVAGEYFFSKGFFESPQNLNRFNLFGKYKGQLSDHTDLSVTVSSFYSKWNASGQIPQRAVDAGQISWYGAIDPTEGGKTSRNNINVILKNYLHNDGVIVNQIYFVDYGFDLYSNFTFYKDDSIRGDQIRQYEHRQVYGYKGAYEKDVKLGDMTIKCSAGIGFRADRIKNIGLAHTSKREFLNDIKKGDIKENNLNAYLNLEFLISEKWSANAGLRYDYFAFQYFSKLNDSILPVKLKGIVSPKINLYYKLMDNVQLYLSGGYGFHSNDTRVSVVGNTTNSLPRASSVDLGTNLKIGKRAFVNAALWYMNMESEYIYAGDNGLLEVSGSTRRRGLELSARYQIVKWMFADLDFTYSKPRYLNLPAGFNYVPLAPLITATGGIGFNSKSGFSGSLRYRCLGKRPAIEDNSLKASGYFILDAVANYQWRDLQFNLSAENLFNKKWREAQFATESRLQGEPEPLREIHFTPGTPFFVKLGVSYLF